MKIEARVLDLWFGKFLVQIQTKIETFLKLIDF